MDAQHSSITAALIAPGGRALAGLMSALLRVRGPRQIHTTGVLLSGTLHRLPSSRLTAGIAWIDERETGEQPVVARLSRGAGLPPALPDVIGLAVRAEGDEGDLLLASSGLGVPGRFLPRLRRTGAQSVLSTLMPYRGTAGPVLIAARSLAPTSLPASMAQVQRALATEPWMLELLFATPIGRWHRFGTLSLRSSPGDTDAATPRFDPVLHPPRGAGTYAWTRALREPAYATGRRGCPVAR